MAKSFEIWVKDNNKYIHIEDEAMYIEYMNGHIRDFDLIEEQLVVYLYLRDLVGG